MERFSLFCLGSLFMIVDASILFSLTSPFRVVKGCNISFTAIVEGANTTNAAYYIDFYDTTVPMHYGRLNLTSNLTKWSLEYSKQSAGAYTMHARLLVVSDFKETEKIEAETTFELTEYLNGDLRLIQDNIILPKNFVAVNKAVNHVIELPNYEKEYLNIRMSELITYWFIDCMFVDETDDFSIEYTYNDKMGTSYIDALIVASDKKRSKRMAPQGVMRINESDPSSNDFKCPNAYVPISDGFIYGHYQKRIDIREPINSVNISEPNWKYFGLNRLMNLLVHYSGSPPFKYCSLFKPGQYNVTGGEECTKKAKTARHSFSIVHSLSENNEYTAVVIIENDLGKVVSTIDIKVNEVLNIGSVLGLYYSNVTALKRDF